MGDTNNPYLNSEYIQSTSYPSSNSQYNTLMN